MYSGIAEPITFEEITLKRLKFAQRKVLSKELLKDLTIDLDAYFDHYLEGMVVTLRAFVFAETESARRVEIKYPEDWTQAFKERWFPKKLKYIFPVLYKKHIIDVKATYPKFKQALPEEECVLRIMGIKTIGGVNY